MDNPSWPEIWQALFAAGTFALAAATFRNNWKVSSLTDVVRRMEHEFQEMKEQTKALQAHVAEAEKQTKVITHQYLLQSRLALPLLIPYFKVQTYGRIAGDIDDHEGYAKTLILKNVGLDASYVTVENKSSGLWNISFNEGGKIDKGEFYKISLTPVTIPGKPAGFVVNIIFEDNLLNKHEQRIVMSNGEARIGPPQLVTPSIFNQY